MSETSQDEKVLALIKRVNEKKEKVASLKAKYSWKTNCSLSIGLDRPINLHAEGDVDKLVAAAGFLMRQEKDFSAGAKEMGVDREYRWQNYSIADWLADIKARIGKLALAEEESQLKKMEDRLNKVVSPELRARLEIEAIEAELG